MIEKTIERHARLAAARIANSIRATLLRVAERRVARAEEAGCFGRSRGTIPGRFRKRMRDLADDLDTLNATLAVGQLFPNAWHDLGLFQATRDTIVDELQQLGKQLQDVGSVVLHERHNRIGAGIVDVAQRIQLAAILTDLQVIEGWTCLPKQEPGK